jgi:hypothetical protein
VTHGPKLASSNSVAVRLAPLDQFELLIFVPRAAHSHDLSFVVGWACLRALQQLLITSR